MKLFLFVKSIFNKKTAEDVGDMIGEIERLKQTIEEYEFTLEGMRRLNIEIIREIENKNNTLKNIKLKTKELNRILDKEEFKNKTEIDTLFYRIFLELRDYADF